MTINPPEECYVSTILNGEYVLDLPRGQERIRLNPSEARRLSEQLLDYADREEPLPPSSTRDAINAAELSLLSAKDNIDAARRELYTHLNRR